jgi:pSer/pThr/pTyr-binding forkhead associated (FHA) protein
MTNQESNSHSDILIDSEGPVEVAGKIINSSTTGGYQAVNFTDGEFFPGAGTFIKGKGGYSEQLSIFRQFGGKWRRLDFPAGKTAIRIGSRREKNDIFIEGDCSVDPIHVVIIYLGNRIFIIERGQSCITYVNGTRTPYAELEDKNPFLLVVGSTNLIIKPKRSDSSGNYNKDRVYLIKTPSGEYHVEFHRFILLGSHDICNLKFEGSEFIGMLLPHAKDIFLIPLSNMRYNGDEIPLLQPCRILSGCLLNSLNASIFIPGGMENENTCYFPVQTHSYLKFIEILDNEEKGVIKMKLPSAGGSFIISRERHDHYMHIKSKFISRQHAQVIVYDKCISVEDLKSRNGTYVNGERIKRKIVYPGDFLSVGDRTFILGYSCLCIT